MSRHVTLPIVFVGMPGAGKSKVGAKLASILGVEHIDTDAQVEERAGRSISDIFARDGEAVFREMEAEVVADALTRQAVISLGGGAVTHERTRALLAGHTVIHLRVPLAGLLRRIASETHRPLLRENPEEVLARLHEQRRAFFEEVRTFVVDADEGPVQAVVNRVQALLAGNARVSVNGERVYDVVIGSHDVVADVVHALPKQSQRLVIVHPQGLSDYVQRVGTGLTEAGYAVSFFVHPDGESAKTVDSLSAGWDAAANARLSRHDAIIGIGGGATTDLAGFIAATWLRGIAVVHVPTTVLGMVDAAVGGKTGINTSAGKNLAGAFHAPYGVVEDLSVLSSLPIAEHRSGLAEVIKCGFIRDHAIVDIVLEDPDAVLSADSEALREVIVRAVRVKADVVGADLHEMGLREILNYGHTLAHAIEKAENYRWRHGEAVSVGCVFAAELAFDLGMLSAADVQLHREVFDSVGLPTSYQGAPVSELIEIMFSDKKVRHGKLRFVLLDGLGVPVTREVTEEQVLSVARRLGMQ